jgi:hypothetical protein
VLRAANLRVFIILKSGVLNLLEPSELVQVCTGLLTRTNIFSPVCSGMDIIHAPHY